MKGEAAAWIEIIRMLADRLGVDFDTVVFPMVCDIQDKESSRLFRIALDARFPTLKHRAALAIPVYDTTTKEDVKKAFQAIAATHPRRPQRGTDPVDDLTAVQCIMWKVRCRATHPQIAAMLGLTPSLDEHAKPRRSNTVGKYIKRGHEILRQAELTAERWQVHEAQN